MQVEIKEVNSKKDLRDFIEFPYRLYKNDPLWIPPIKKSEWDYWQNHPGHKKNTVKTFLAFKNGKPAGRIAYLVIPKYNELNNTKTARFFALEAIDDKEVFDALINRAESEARNDGMEHIHGPLGFNNLDHQGLQVEGFTYPQTLVSVYNKPYYKDHMERLGYVKEKDWLEYRITLSDRAIERGNKAEIIVKKRFGLVSWQPRDKEELRRTSDTIFELYNQSYKHLHYMVPLDEEDIAFYKKNYESVLSPEWSYFVKDPEKDKIVAFMLAMPSLGDALRKARGKLFPLGWWHLLKALKKPKEIDITIIGTHPDYIHKGAAALIFKQFHDTMLRYGIKEFETGGIFEDNYPVLKNWKNYPHIQHKKKRVYGKDLRAK